MGIYRFARWYLLGNFLGKICALNLSYMASVESARAP